MGKDFFTKAFKEGYTEGEQVEKDIPDDVIPDAEVEIPKVTVPAVETEKVVDEPPVKTYDIDGINYTADEIKEWKQNGLRQSDYTRKTQELANQRKQLEDLGTSIPVLGNSEADRISRLENELATNNLVNKITELKAKYSDFDEVAVLTEAQNRRMYDNEDLEFVYRAIRKESSSTPIDMEAFKKQSIEEYKVQIATEKQKNKDATSGSIIGSTPAKVEVDYESSLGDAEKAFCQKRGWTYKQYVEDKNAVY